MRQKYASIDLDAEKVRNKESEIASIQRQVEYQEKQIASQKNRLNSAKEEAKPNLNVPKLKEEVAELQKNQEENAGKKTGYEYLAEKLKWWNTTGFGSNGLKSFVFKAMLSNLNHFVQKYVSRFGVGVEFSIDMTKASKPFVTKCYIDGIEVDYEEFSGGEKQRVDIALAFAMHDLVSIGSSFNVLILDEALENLDAKGMEVVFDLIRVKAGDDKGVFIITHSAEIDSLNTKTVYVRKNKSGSFME